MKIVALRDKGWYDKRTEQRMWDHLCRAYDIEFEIMTDEQIKELDENQVVVFEESGETPIEEFVHQEDKIYVFGRTLMNIRDYFPNATSVKIKTPNRIPLFGSIAAAIVLYDRWLKWQ